MGHLRHLSHIRHLPNLSGVGPPAAAAGASYTGYAAEVDADAPYVWLRLGEASGTPVDEMGVASPTVTGTPTQGSTGLAPGDDDKAVLFNTDGQIALGVDTVSGQNNSAMECLVKTSDSGTIRFIMTSGTNLASNTTTLRMTTTGKAQVTVSQVSITLTSTTSINDDAVHHVCVTVTDGDLVRLYVDGVEEAVSSSIVTDLGDTLSAFQGASTDSIVAALTAATTSNRFIGTIDEVAYYRSALSAARVLAHATAAGVV